MGKEKSLPLKLRLKAWWEGYDPDELKARLGSDAEEAPETEPQVRKHDVSAGPNVTPPSGGAADEDEAVDDALPMDPWNQERIDVAQYIWGKGFCGPGGPEHVIAMSKLLNLSPEMSVIEIGAGLGGRARTLCDRFGAWMSGYESSAELARVGMEMSTMAGMERKATVTHYDPENPADLDRKFDRALAKEAFFTIQNKAALLQATYDQIKPDGLLLLTDYVLGDESVVGKDKYREWKKGENNAPKPITSDELTALVKEARFSVRVSEDITPLYIGFIADAWAGADKVVAQLMENDDKHLIDVLLHEAEFWSRRANMLKSGDLRVWRILGYKKTDPNAKGMSDW